VPLGLTADTDLRLISEWHDTRVMAGLLCLALLLRVLWVASRARTARSVAFGIAWFGIALVPSSRVFPLAEVANEHRVFLPYLGLVLAVVWWLALRVQHWYEAWPQWRPMLLPLVCTVALLVLGGHAVGTYQRNKVWRSEATLWRDVVRKSPTNGRAL